MNPTNSQQPHQPQPVNHQQAYAPQQSRSRAPWIVLVVVVIVVLAALAFLFRDKLKPGASNSNVSDYQAVFLTNGQVYFGKLSDAQSQYITLTDIYYLQVNQQLQQGQTQTQTQQQPQLSLVKLGQELHGPVDEMHINRDQVLFYEQLKNDGQVVKAIKQYQQNGNNAPAGTTGTTGTAPQQQSINQAPAQSTQGTTTTK